MQKVGIDMQKVGIDMQKVGIDMQKVGIAPKILAKTNPSSSLKLLNY
jgi:hypothetical protein